MAEVQPMSRIYAIVEGQTEQVFVREVLAPWLGVHNVFLSAKLIGGTKRKGGIGRYESSKRQILNLCNQELDVFFTTMLDFYGMPPNWPGRIAADTANHEQKATVVQTAIHSDICQSLGDAFNPVRFIPYVQMHEFEALLYCSPEITAEELGDTQLAPKLIEIRNQFTSPEHINDDIATAPSKRIESIFGSFDKPTYGSKITERIGIETLMAHCPLFAEWVQRLLATNSP